MKHTTFIIAILFSNLCCLFSQTATSPMGSGTEVSPYEVSTVEHLYWISQNSTSSEGLYFIQMNDIDASVSNSWTYKWPTYRSFKGVYDGQNYKITGIENEGYYTGGVYNYSGIFYSIGGGANTTVIKNLTFENIQIDFTNSSGKVGVLCGSIEDDVELSNVIIKNSTINTTTSGDVGGLAGSVSGDNVSIDSVICDVTVDADNSSFIGGLLGSISGESLSVINSSTYGSIASTESGAVVGGFVGKVTFKAAIIENSFSELNVNCSDTYSGGFLGAAFGKSPSEVVTVRNCYAIGDVSGYKASGFLAINSADVLVENSFSASSISGSVEVGFGDNPFATVNNCFWDAEWSGVSNSLYGTGKTSAEMKTLSTYTNSGWDFVGESTNGTTNIWTFDINTNYGYPMLTNVPTLSSISTLPVDLISLVSENLNDKVHIRWATASEKHNDYFLIEKSTDGKEWILLSSIKGIGYSSTKTDYVLVDDKPTYGNSYYRLTQVDFNGDKEVFKPIYHYREKNDIVIPTLLSSGDYITINSSNSFLNVFILDSSGKIKVRKSNINNSSISTSGFESGIYMVILQNNLYGEVVKKRIVVK